MNINKLLLEKTARIIGSNKIRMSIRACDENKRISYAHVNPNELDDHKDALLSGAAMPIGSVAFVRAAMAIAKIDDPHLSPYPESLNGLLKRSVTLKEAGSVTGRKFVKPLETKIFNGFVFDAKVDPCDMSNHDRKQFGEFMAMPAQAKVWVSEPIKIASEWRYYVLDGEILGCARYDFKKEDAKRPNIEDVKKAAKLAYSELGHAFALDIGITDGGEMILVEVNDAWATGVFGAAITAKQYIDWLSSRWESMRANSS